jgi:AbrB family looped-hinge helix DNA binding protein
MSTPSERKLSYAHLPTTSAKIRELAAQGVSRADIARELGIRYQHVRNVLTHDENKSAKAKAGGLKETAQEPAKIQPAKIRIGPDGRIVIPAAFRDALHLAEGDTLFARLEDGGIRLVTATAAMRQAQAIVREFVPEGVSLVDELIADRRREVEQEEHDG